MSCNCVQQLEADVARLSEERTTLRSKLEVAIREKSELTDVNYTLKDSGASFVMVGGLICVSEERARRRLDVLEVVLCLANSVLTSLLRAPWWS